MKKLLASLMVIGGLSMAGSAIAGELRIMPMGDSITYGSHSAATAGYRGPLYTLLTNAGYTNIKFVGTATDTPGTLPSDQQHHEGHSGWIIKNCAGSTRTGMYDYLPTSFSQILGPHVILVHLGTNDASDSSDFTQVMTRLDALLDRISEMQPSAEIIVTTLLQRTDNVSRDEKITTYYNPYLPGVVSAHVARGQKVHLYDMRPKVAAPAELDDGLHPNATGYTHMAEGWLEAIQSIVSPATDYPEVQPAVVTSEFTGSMSTGTVTLRLNVPVTATSVANLANYAVAPQGTVEAAALSQDGRTVTVSLAGLAKDADATLTVQGLANESESATMAFKTIAFHAATTPGVDADKVGELPHYELVYDLDILAKLAVYNTNAVDYAVDNHLKVGKFSRVAYYLELQKSGGPVQYVWASMDAFTDDAGKIGVPTVASGTDFMKRVSNLRVYSNAEGVPTGDRGEGNIEFHHYNYSPGRTLGIASASNSDYDNDDSHSREGNYGSMQVHDVETGTTLFAYNLWGGRSIDNNGSGKQDLGIGNCPTAGKRDWTRIENSDTYTLRHLQVYVMPDVDDVEAPALVSAERAANGTQIVLTFSKPMMATGLLPCFSLSSGMIEGAARRADNPRIVEITTSAIPADVTLTIEGLRDAAPKANLLPTTTVPLSGRELPPSIASQVDSSLTAGYTLVYTIDIPLHNPGWTSGNAGKEIYTVDRTPLRNAFDRVAYFLELDTADGQHKYVWTSMKAFTDNEDYIGVPLKRFGKLWDVRVEDLEVASNVAGVSTGTGINGAIEFGYGGFNSTADSGYEGASSSAYDFDDTLQTSNDYGCMQVHNLDAKKVVWDFGRWGRTGSFCELGIGNSPSGQPDYTFSENGHIYTRRVLHVLVRPTADLPAMPARIRENVTEAADYQVVYQLDLPDRGDFGDATKYANNIMKINRSAGFPVFDRQAYYLELVSTSNPSVTNWVWTSFDAVTRDATKLTIPGTSTEQWTFWQKVDRMNVFSNVASIQTGTDIATGNIEFHNKNFGANNSLNLPNASGTAYDFGDSPSADNNHGCMQVHNYGARQTVWAVNKFYRATGSDYLCVGIGNRPSNTNTDWTNANNARDYSVKRLFILARPALEGTCNLTLDARHVTVSRSRQQVCVSFMNGLVSDVSDLAAACAFSDETAVVVKAERSPTEPRDLLLTLARPLAADTSYTLTVGGKTLSFKTMPEASPSVLDAAKIPELGDYRLVNVLPLPVEACYSHYGADYLLDESRFNPGTAFDRVAYCLELKKGVIEQWVWVSFDAPEKNVAKIGLPSIYRGILTWCEVTDMNVLGESSDGNFPCHIGRFAKGNIEFCACNYGATCTNGYANASSSLFDFDDTVSWATINQSGCGSMQVHNPGLGETVFSVSSFGNLSYDTPRTLSIGIGTSPNASNAIDWTYARNAAEYSVKNLYVLVRPIAAVDGDQRFLVQPEDDRLIPTRRPTLTLTACAVGAVGYQWRVDGEAIPFASSASLTLDIETAMAGDYDVVAIYPDGSQVVSRTASVTIAPTGTLILMR